MHGTIFDASVLHKESSSCNRVRKIRFTASLLRVFEDGSKTFLRVTTMTTALKLVSYYMISAFFTKFSCTKNILSHVTIINIRKMVVELKVVHLS